MMTNELSTQTERDFLFPAKSAHGSINHGAVAIEQERAIAEAQGQLVLAKRFPRSMAQATADFMESCKSPEFAAAAFYSVPNRGSGQSIRFMEEAARCYGNFQYGHRELSRSEGKSEIEVYAWDMEKNNRSIRQITVLHEIYTKNGPKKLIDQTDIDNRIANVASKQVRGRIAALMPKALIAAGVAACKLTIAGDNDDPISARISRMVAAFSRYGVTAEMLSQYVGHSLDSVTVDELSDMIGIYNALREGAKPSEYFNSEEQQSESKASVNAKISRSADAAQPAPAAAKPEPKPEARPEPDPMPEVESNGPGNDFDSNAVDEDEYF